MGAKNRHFREHGNSLCQGLWVEGRLEQRKGWRGRYIGWCVRVRVTGAGKGSLRLDVLFKPHGLVVMSSILESDTLAFILSTSLSGCATSPSHLGLTNLFLVFDPPSSEMEGSLLGKKIFTVFIPLLSPMVSPACEGFPLLHAELPKWRGCTFFIVGCVAWLRAGTLYR